MSEVVVENRANVSDESNISLSRSNIPSFGGYGQEIYWFPLRVAYGRLSFVIKELIEQKVEHFIPMETLTDTDSEENESKQIPMLDDLVFVRCTKQKITELKHSGTALRYLRFITFIPKSEQHRTMSWMERSRANRILVIPDFEMQGFMKALALQDTTAKLIPYSEIFNHIGKKIKILQGPLKGYIGILRRIKKNNRVHIDCGGLLTVELGYMPKTMYELVEDDNNNKKNKTM